MIEHSNIATGRRKRMAAVRFLPGLILLVLGFHWVTAFGEEIPDGPPLVEKAVEPATDAISDNVYYIDRSHASIDRKINKVVTWFDGLFGDAAKSDPIKAENNLRWSNQLRMEEGENLRFRSSLRAHLHLPRFKKRAKLVIMEENREEAVAPVPSDPGTPAVNTPTDANSFRAVHTEFRYYAHDVKSGYVFLAAGSRFVWPPETFVRARLQWRRYLAEKTLIAPSVTPFWQDHIGFGITPQLDFGHPFPRDYIFLWKNSATLYEKRSGLLWGTEASIARVLSPVSAIAFAVGANGSTHPSEFADRFNMAANHYKVSARYRRNIYRPWLFLELIPEANWLRQEAAERRFTQAFTVRLEINTLGARALLPVPVVVKERSPVLEYVPD
ncbi:MAG: hypothetical protein IH577_00385 [Deltaproteobacteria bacterium]|nr:hypothetical protein [Deltaproteobacteria bacterium]